MKIWAFLIGKTTPNCEGCNAPYGAYVGIREPLRARLYQLFCLLIISRDAGVEKALGEITRKKKKTKSETRICNGTLTNL